MPRAIVRGLYSVALLLAMVLPIGIQSSPALASDRLSPSPASCAGTHHHHISGGRASVFMSYFSDSGGRNCVWVQKDTGRGTKQEFIVIVERCKPGNWEGRSTCPTDKRESVRESIEYYAGPVNITGMAGRCIMVHVDVLAWGTRYSVPPHHCG